MVLMAAAQPVQVRSVSCPNCGGAVQLRGFAHTLSVVCPQCHSVLDTSTPEVRILQSVQSSERIQPAVPLGTRGEIHGTQYEVIGFQVREAGAGTETWSWNEYLLFNPWKGFRYLTEYQGHWNFVRTETALPARAKRGGKLAASLEGRTYLLFDRMTARTAYVLGEFPWRVHVGDSAECQDFVSPPYMLSSESTAGETTWSSAEYTRGREIWKAFRLPGSPPITYGTFANQPSPYRGVGAAWRTWLWLNLALLLLAIVFAILSPTREVFKDQYEFVRRAGNEPAFVTPAFTLAGRDSNVQLKIHTNLNNSWAWFGFALINNKTGQAFDFAREVSKYSDEGSQNDSVIIPNVPSGQYYLRVEPEVDSATSLMRYDLTLHRDVPNYAFFWVAAGLLLIPPVIKTIRSASFEAARWRESDYGTAVSVLTSGGNRA
jgi:hypothetical protein